MIKHTITGKKGKTVCYTIANIDFTANTLTWDPFIFYTPHGDLTDAQGNKYFNVPPDSITLQREELDKRFYLKISVTAEPELIVIYQDEKPAQPLVVGLEGDICVYGHIPTDPLQEIQIHYKEVLSDPYVPSVP